MEDDPVGRAVARYDYIARESEEISVQGGDELAVYGSFEEDWWIALNAKTGEKGYVPSNFCIRLNSDSSCDQNESLGSYTTVINTAREANTSRSTDTSSVTNSERDRNSDTVAGSHSNSIIHTEKPPPPPRPPKSDTVRNILKTNIEDSVQKIYYMKPSPELYRVMEDYGIYENFDDEHLDFSVNAGDEVEVLEKREDGRWRCRSLYSQQEGFISKNDLTQVNALRNEDYFIGKLDREGAAKLLLSCGGPEGYYAIRESDNSEQLALSVINNVKEKKVSHYKIKKDDDDKYYIYKDENFTSVQELIKHYKEGGGLKDNIGTPYKKDHHAWDISEGNIKIEAMLGSGYFGTVYKAVWTAERRSINVAVKTFNLNTPKIQDEFKSECSSMRKLRHPCLVRLYGTCTKNKLMIVMEMLEKGDLKTYLETDNVNRTEVYQLLKFCYQISCGMAYLESQGIAHRDLAARNILLDDERNIKIADFGLSRMLLGGTYRGKSNIFPTKWTAIEYFEKKIYTMKCDVWSYGVLIWEIFSFGKEPYEELEGSAAIQNFLKNGNRLSKPEDCPDVIYHVVMKVCWTKDPDERPSFTDIKEILREHTERFYVNTTVA